MTVSTPRSTATRAMFCEPVTFTSTHSIGCFSARSTNFVAAAWMTTCGRASTKASRTDSMLHTSIGTVSQPVNFSANWFCLLFRAVRMTR